MPQLYRVQFHRIRWLRPRSMVASASARSPPVSASKSMLKISVPGLPREQVEALVQKAHIVCPYSNATRGNIDVKLVVA
jgi:organic hydroperoxide reductase OsmC/OhrA